MRTLFKTQEEWSPAVIGRDGKKCQLCGADKKVDVVAHHIVPAFEPELLGDIDNGITLCNNHHLSLHKSDFDSEIFRAFRKLLDDRNSNYTVETDYRY